MSNGDIDDGLYHFAFKVVLLGDTGVGKSSLVLRQTGNNNNSSGGGNSSSSGANNGNNNTFSEESTKTRRKGTTGVNFKTALFVRKPKIYQVQLWDTPGSERYLKLTSRFAAGAAVAIFVYDINNRVTFEHMEDWIQNLEKNNPVLIKMLFGNKTDQRSNLRQVMPHEAEQLAEKHGMIYREGSAENMMDHSVEDAFDEVIDSVIDLLPDLQDASTMVQNGIKLGRLLLDDPEYLDELYSDSLKGLGLNKNENQNGNQNGNEEVDEVEVFDEDQFDEQLAVPQESQKAKIANKNQIKDDDVTEKVDWMD